MKDTVTGQRSAECFSGFFYTLSCAKGVEKWVRKCRIAVGMFRQFFAFKGGDMGLSFSAGRSKLDTSSVRFTFNIEKTIAAMAVFANGRQGAKLDMFLSLKRLYLADRRALISWGKTITGDSMISMDKGPLLSTVYDLFKGRVDGEDKAEYLKKWKSYFGDTSDNMVQILRPISLGILSSREIEALRAAQEEIGEVPPNELPSILHQRYPEWEDPHGGSKTIDPATILRKEGRSDDEIRRIEEEAEAFNSDAKMFRSLAEKTR